MTDKKSSASIVNGGARRNAGKKRRPLEEKILEGSKKRPLEVISFAKEDNLILIESSIPHEFIDDKQLNQISGETVKTYARQIYDETYNWLKTRRVAQLVPKLLLERYASESANWIYCLSLTRKHGHFRQNQKRETLEVSPWAKQAVEYGARSDSLWNQIYLTVRDNSSVKYEGESPHNDTLAQILDW